MEPKSIMDMALIPIDPVEIGLGSSEKVIAATSVKPRKKTMTSVYLKYFETASDGKSRRCKLCGQSYSIATATGNLGRHLTNRHPGYDKSSTGDNNFASPTPHPLATVTVAKKPQPQLKTSQVVDYDHLNWLLVKWLVITSLPPSTVEERWLGNSYKFLNPSVQLWPGDRYRAVFHEVHRSMQEDIRASLSSLSSKLSIALDFWTSYEQIHYMSVTSHWIDDTWTLQTLLLDICHVPYPCGGPEIHRCLVKTLKTFGVENRVLSCTHDNSQAAIHACHALRDDLDGQIGSFCYIPCAARALDSIIEDGLRTVKPLVCRVREFVLGLNSSADISEDFVRIAAACQEGSWKFPLDASARWSGSYQMLDVVRKAGKSMDAVMRKYEETLGNSRIVLNPEEKNAIHVAHEYLESFHKTTTNICTSKVPTVGLVLFFMDHILEMIVACRDSRHIPNWLKLDADEMEKKARSYNNQMCNIFSYMAAILDPRIKSELIPESLNSESFLEQARSHFTRNYSSPPAGHFPAAATATSGGFDDGGEGSFAEEIARKRRRASMGNAVADEVTQYLLEPPAAIPTDVLEWWKVNSARYPRLSAMARDFLAMRPASRAPHEVFSGDGEAERHRRLCVPHEATRALLCVRSWVMAGMKLKFKSTEIDYDRLMELAVAVENRN